MLELKYCKKKKFQSSNLNSFIKDNYTPLHVAVENCKYLVVQMLLGYGADVQIRGGKAKETPLHIAAKIKGTRCQIFDIKKI